MKTKQYVITGAPCAGKTTVILELEKKGYPVVHEAARALIEEGMEKGKTFEQVIEDKLPFEREILHRKVAKEELLPKNEIVFLDRAVPDSIAYYKAHDLDPREPLEKSKGRYYNTIFLFQRLIFSNDPIRYEDEDFARKIDLLLRESYEMLGYDIVDVPVLSVMERVDFILDRL